MSSQRSHIPELQDVTFGWVASAEGKINTRDPDPAINTQQYFFLLGLTYTSAGSSAEPPHLVGPL